MGSGARVRARAWCRVDLAGGTLDIWPLGLLHPGACTVNLALDLGVEIVITGGSDAYRVIQGEARVEAPSARALAETEEAGLVGLILEELELPAVEVEVRSDSPRGGGLGASSALAVGLIAAGEKLLGRRPSSPRSRAAMARDLEARLLGIPTGMQDHLPALLGGALEVRHQPGGESVRVLRADLEALAASLLVLFTGKSHFSADNNWKMVRRRLDGEPRIVALFDGIRDVARQVPAALEAGDLEAVGRLMNREWELRRGLAEGISTPAIERLLEMARRRGAWGGKACGAGGGGCIVLLTPAELRETVAAALEDLGARRLRARPAAGPLVLEQIG